MSPIIRSIENVFARIGVIPTPTSPRQLAKLSLFCFSFFPLTSKRWIVQFDASRTFSMPPDRRTMISLLFRLLFIHSIGILTHGILGQQFSSMTGQQSFSIYSSVLLFVRFLHFVRASAINSCSSGLSFGLFFSLRRIGHLQKPRSRCWLVCSGFMFENCVVGLEDDSNVLKRSSSETCMANGINSAQRILHNKESHELCSSMKLVDCGPVGSHSCYITARGFRKFTRDSLDGGDALSPALRSAI